MKLFIRLSGKEINKYLFKSSIFSSLFSQRQNYLVWGQVGWSDLWILTGMKSSKEGRNSVCPGNWGRDWVLVFSWDIGPEGQWNVSVTTLGLGSTGLLGSCSGWNPQVLLYLRVGSGPFILITKCSPSCLAHHWDTFHFSVFFYVSIPTALIQVLIPSPFHPYLPLSLTGLSA